jgi:hypothetical protein
MQVLGLTPNCLPIPKLSRTPNGKTIVGVSRETHNALTHSLTLLVSHLSLSVSYLLFQHAVISTLLFNTLLFNTLLFNTLCVTTTASPLYLLRYFWYL